MRRKKKLKIIDVLKFLEKEGINYVVVGGVAVVLYGYERYTKDIDLILDFSKENVNKFVNLMNTLGFTPRIPEDPQNLSDEKKGKSG